MEHIKTILRSFAIALAMPTLALAQVFNGGGLEEGVGTAGGIAGPVQMSLRTFITNILVTVLNFLALAAVIAVIVAGIYLIISGGNEENKEKAKRIILYVIIGLLVVLFARAFVSLFTNGAIFGG